MTTNTDPTNGPGRGTFQQREQLHHRPRPTDLPELPTPPDGRPYRLPGIGVLSTRGRWSHATIRLFPITVTRDLPNKLNEALAEGADPSDVVWATARNEIMFLDHLDRAHGRELMSHDQLTIRQGDLYMLLLADLVTAMKLAGQL